MSTMDTDQVLATIRNDLHRHYSHDLDNAEIDRIFDEIVSEHEARATQTRFLPVLVERDAVEKIENIVFTEPLRTAQSRRDVLFVNRDNGTMAEVAAALLEVRVGDRLRAAAAGTHPENSSDEKLLAEARKRELDKNRKRRPTSHRVLDTPEMTIYLNSDETRDMGGRRHLVWDLPSTDGMNEAQIAELVDELDKRINGLIELLDVAPAEPALAS
ncbi:hypothetical protein C3B44_10965 [Corynebacterium yudongzhengii]|uniref:Protein tyrosine phosphatase n=1 Tax=Corynebacterium yudongzhengii TaxID=2080740 RepID=A0A2U1T823_9CORY|nr:hypothetical protein [Corynebacterium yudongzhengii]AWB82786.1 hypothetical protein C3B44_10965 [Corynebacterium yudongzhengii]PWC02154.1 hypothetical protein DF222_03430 [Corynebacterium yudongzhengii]